MAFPDTRVSLIGRLVQGAAEADWAQFLSDYWEPLCGFARRWGGMPLEDAEDITSNVFLVLWESDLLSRWKSDPRARLKTLLCAVARRLISNRARVAECRSRILAELASLPRGQAVAWIADDVQPDEADAFLKEWVEKMLQSAIDTLLLQCHSEGKGDYFRVLYGRLCEDLSMREIADALQIEVTTAENFLKTAKTRLRKELERTVREHAQRYSDDPSIVDEEWGELSEYLMAHGGIEAAVKRSQRKLDGDLPLANKSQLLNQTKRQLSAPRPAQGTSASPLGESQ